MPTVYPPKNPEHGVCDWPLPEPAVMPEEAPVKIPKPIKIPEKQDA